MKTAHLIPTLTLITICSFTSYSQNKNPGNKSDTTIVNKLKELIVEGHSQQLIEEGVSYIPDKKSKKFAIDAIDLLSHMEIPQLMITADNIVKTIANQDVSIFIDYLAATAEDLAGLMPEDVKRIEVLDYPSDVRFHQAEHVVNFVMRKYEWGGYTKLTASTRLMNDDNITGILYSKFSYKNFTLDINGRGSGTWASQGKQDSHETFRDFNFGNTHYDILTKNMETGRFKRRDNSQNAGLRAIYQRDDVFLSHVLSLARDAMPVKNRYSEVNYSNPSFPSSRALQSDNDQVLAIWASGDYYFSLPQNNSLSAGWTMGYQGARSYSEYKLGDNIPILNGEKSSFYYPQASISHSKSFGHDNSLTTTVASYNFIYDTRYSGSADANNKILPSNSQILFYYLHRWDFGLRFGARIGASYFFMKENGIVHTKQWRPSIYLSLDYTLNAMNRFAISGSWYSSGQLHDITSDVITRENELLWRQGNPNIGSNDNKWIRLSYTYIPRNNINLTAAALYYDYNHIPVSDFQVLDGYNGLVHTYSSDNREQNLECALGVSLKLFNRALTLSGSANFNHQRNTGLLNMKGSYLNGMISARWAYKNISARIFYASPKKTMFQQQGYVTRTSETYSIECSYSLKDFRMFFRFSNWFSQGSIHKTFESPLYSNVSTSWYRPHSRSFSMTLTYTFPYGKKIDRNNEFNAAQKPSLSL